jgi:hypothetical protein
MPRRRNLTEDDIIATMPINLPDFPPVTNTRLADEYLKNNYYDLLKKTDAKLECPVCMDDMMDCKRCFALLVPCGHAIHSSCFMRITNGKCPTCRS